VPAVAGDGRCVASEPANPRTSTIGRNLPNNIANPRVVLYQTVLTLIPAKAEPLLLTAEVYAYRTSDSPCGPVFNMDSRADAEAIAAAVPTSTKISPGNTARRT
jgi:hypothetical protein